VNNYHFHILVLQQHTSIGSVVAEECEVKDKWKTQILIEIETIFFCQAPRKFPLVGFSFL
jgi:hypothetical protein